MQRNGALDDLDIQLWISLQIHCMIEYVTVNLNMNLNLDLIESD